jgi:hypothetical protein
LKKIAVIAAGALLAAGCALHMESARDIVAGSATVLADTQKAWIDTCIEPAVMPVPHFCNNPATKAAVKSASAKATKTLDLAIDAVKVGKLDAATLLQLATDAQAAVTAYSSAVAAAKGGEP